MMHSNNFSKTTAKYFSSPDPGFYISPDVTVEFVKSNTGATEPKGASADRTCDDDDYQSYFNPLIYCAVTMDDDEKGSTCQQNNAKPSTIVWEKSEFKSTMKKPTSKNTRNNENSSSVCNSADSNTGGKVKKRFSCHICQKTFGWTTDLKRHILIHTGERPFKCNICFATFTRNSLLQKHKTKIHQCSSPNGIFQLNNNVARNLTEIKLKMSALENAKTVDEEDKIENPKC